MTDHSCCRYIDSLGKAGVFFPFDLVCHFCVRRFFIRMEKNRLKTTHLFVKVKRLRSGESEKNDQSRIAMIMFGALINIQLGGCGLTS